MFGIGKPTNTRVRAFSAAASGMDTKLKSTQLGVK